MLAAVSSIVIVLTLCPHKLRTAISENGPTVLLKRSSPVTASGRIVYRFHSGDSVE